MAARKLQQEIDKTLKKVYEGIEGFDDTWDKMESTDTPALREKLEADLKKRIKKLQQSRDMIKTWIAGSEIKDKSELIEARKAIEKEMERFKACEKESKTKAFSKEGLDKRSKQDPKQKEKQRQVSWIGERLTELEEGIDKFESQIEGLSGGGKKKSKGGGGGNAEKKDTLLALIQQHRFHIEKLELILRLLTNDDVTSEQIEELHDDVDYYIENHEDPDHAFDDGLYDELIESAGPEAAMVATEVKVIAGHKEVEKKNKDDADSKKNAKSRKKSDPNADAGAAGGAGSGAGQSGAGGGGSHDGKGSHDAKGSQSGNAGSSSSDPPTGELMISNNLGTRKRPTVEDNEQADTHAPATSKAGGRNNNNSNSNSNNNSNNVASASKDHGPQGGSHQTRTASDVVASGGPQLAKSAFPPLGGGSTGGPSQDASTAPPPGLTAASVVASSKQQPGGSSGSSANPSGAVSQPGHQVPSPQMMTQMQQQQQQMQMQHMQQQMQQQQQMQMQMQNSSAGMMQQQQQQQQHVQVCGLDQGEPATPAAMLQLLSGAAMNLPDSNFSNYDKGNAAGGYRPLNPYPVSPKYPQMPHPAIEAPGFFEKLDSDTLFFAFYYQQGTARQYAAARELKRQSWRYHKKYLTWFQRHEEPKVTTEDHESGTFVYFDYESGWCQRIKQEFTFEYGYLEDELPFDTASF